MGVLDKHLKENGTGWLVGDKCTYADLSFVPWDMMLTFLMGEEAVRIQERYPDFTRWHGKFGRHIRLGRICDDERALMN